MPGQDILVVIETAAGAAHRLAPAAVLARRFKARLTGFFATGLPVSTGFAELEGWTQMVEAYMTAQLAEGKRAEAAFRAELKRLALDGDWLSSEADLTQSVTETARLYDLVVLGQPEAGLGSRMRPEEVVLAAGRPVLMVPYAGEFAELGRHPLIAWNGTREAARALHDAMFVIETAEKVTLIEVDQPTFPGVAAADVAAALKRRGVVAAVESSVSDGTPVPDIILSFAADCGADLIVMGAYGHSRLREFVLGGVSRSIFQEMTVPILMAH